MSQGEGLPSCLDQPRCPYRPHCPGCPRFGEEGVSAAVQQELSDLAQRVGSTAPRFIAGSGLRSRHRVRLMVRNGRQGVLEAGIFAAGSHELVPIPQCPLHHASIEEVLGEVLRAARDAGVLPYDETAHSGELRTIQLAVERLTGTVQVVLVTRSRAGSVSAELQSVAEGLMAVPLVHSVWLNHQPERTNTLLGTEFSPIAGPDAMRDTSGGAAVFYPPDAFGQANPALHDQAVEMIHRWIPRVHQVAEYHAGVGTIGLGLLARGQQVDFNEMGAGSLRGLRLGIEELERSLGAPPSARLFVGRASEHVTLLEDAETVVVDPPRKGLESELVSALCRRPPLRLAYLSCGLPSLIRDLDHLAVGPEAPLRVSAIAACPWFPYGQHVETLVLLQRRPER